MRQFLSCITAAGLLLACLQGPAQCVYVSAAAGNWSSPSTWTVSGGPGCGGTPISSGTVVINHAVRLNQDFNSSSVGSNHGTITITPTGSLTEDGTRRRLSFGDGTGAQRQRLTARGPVRVSQLVFDKSDAVFTVPSTVYCNLTLNNQSSLLIQNTQLTVEGNYNLINGNVTAGGAGRLLITGCVTGTNGFLNQTIIMPLIVCVLNRPTVCGTGTCNGDVPLNNDANCSLILPVRWLSFRAEYTPASGQVRLWWQTASEENNLFFVVEHSTDGLVFTEMGRMAGAGTTALPSSYVYTAGPPPPGVQYYRLRQVDADGRWSYSKVVAVRVDEPPGLVLQPLGNGEYALQLPGARHAAQVRVSDLLGRTVFSATLPAGRPECRIRVATGGVYVVQVRTGDTIRHARLAGW